VEAFAGRYVLIDLVGTGGMGSVWRAWDLRRKAYVAAKVLGQHDAATLLRFVREQSLRIDHPHVVAPHGWAADDDKVVFAMDLVRGGSVATLLGDHGPLPESYVAVLLDQLLHGLSAVHAAGIVHRDLKPANLLLDATGTGRPHLRLSDFGIAGLLDEPRMTRHSTVLGTPGYIAPEQLAGADPDPRQDLYTVGAVAAELLTGTRPDHTGALPPVDGSLVKLIQALTDPTPAARPSSAAEAGRLLAQSGLLPLPQATPWTTHPDPPEVFNQLPTLPPHWTPTGPSPTTPTKTAPPTAAPVTAAPQTPAPTAPAHQAPSPQTPARRAPATQAPAAQAPAGQTPAAHAPAGQTPAAHAPAGQAPAGHALAAQTPASNAPAAHALAGQAAGSQALAGQAAGGQALASPATGDQRASRSRTLVWVAAGSFTGAIALLSTAAWLLAR
jgi:serine/threonine-protein kinase